MSILKLTFILTVIATVAGAVVSLIFVEGLGGPLFALLLVAVPVFLYRVMFQPLLQAEAVLQHGELATATVLQVWDTGTTVNENPQLGLRLEVQPLGDAPFQAESKSVVSRLLVGGIRPGAVVQVKYDPRDRRKVAVVPGAEVQPTPQGAAARLQELDALRERGLVTQEEYERKRREILDAL